MPFKLNSKEYDISITYWDAVTVYKKRFNIDLVALFEESNLDTLLARMYLSDSLALELMEYYTKDDQPWEETLKNLRPIDVKHFKDAWWETLLSFFDPLRSDFLREVLKKAPKLIKEQMATSLSTSGSSNSLEKPE
jgi:hypothetical protein